MSRIVYFAPFYYDDFTLPSHAPERSDIQVTMTILRCPAMHRNAANVSHQCITLCVLLSIRTHKL